MAHAPWEAGDLDQSTLIVTDQGRFHIPSCAGRPHLRAWLAPHGRRAGGRRPPNCL